MNPIHAPGRAGRRAPIACAAAALAAIAVVAFAPVRVPLAAEAPAAGAGAKANPHAEMKCAECHSRIPEKGTGARGGAIDFLVKDPVGLCRECHPV
ncbi:MAG: hypothetical protein ACM3NF_05370, partial [Gemmatimonadota bacterium]